MTTLEEDTQFAAILEECCRRMRGGESLDRCLEDYPAEYRTELGRLVPLAARVEGLGRDPSPEFQARLEQRLMASVDEARRARRPGMLGELGRFVLGSLARVGAVAAIAFVLLVGSGVGVVEVSAESLPDSPLYQVKAAKEWVQLALARDPESQVAVRASQIGERAREMERAVQPGRQRKVAETVASRVEKSAEKMVDQALERAREGRPQPAIRALVAIRTMQRRLTALEAQASPETRPVIEDLRSSLQRQERRIFDAAPALRQNRGAAPGQPGARAGSSQAAGR